MLMFNVKRETRSKVNKFNKLLSFIYTDKSDIFYNYLTKFLL
jgi:hypothetical protein